MITFSAELVTDTYSYYTEWRVIYSVIGYTVRPVLIYITLLISMRTELLSRKERLLAIPAVLNLCVYLTAFFSDVAFGYTEQNIFYRGPLGFCSHVTIGFYLIALLVDTTQRAIYIKKFEQVIIYLMATVITASMLIETALPVRNIGRTSIIICTIFYFMVFQNGEFNIKIDDERRQVAGLATKVKLDPMTKLLNKESFEKYCVKSLNAHKEESVAFFFTL